MFIEFDCFINYLNTIETIVKGDCKDGWLQYFFYDCKGNLSEAEIFICGIPVKIESWEDIYCFLTDDTDWFEDFFKKII